MLPGPGLSGACQKTWSPQTQNLLNKIVTILIFVLSSTDTTATTPNTTVCSMSHLVQRGVDGTWEPAHLHGSLANVLENPPNPRCNGRGDRHYFTLAHNPSVAVVVDDAHMKPYNTADVGSTERYM